MQVCEMVYLLQVSVPAPRLIRAGLGAVADWPSGAPGEFLLLLLIKMLAADEATLLSGPLFPQAGWSIPNERLCSP